MIPGSLRLGTAAALLALSMLGCTGASDEAAITGTVTYRERMALPPDADITVSLLDVSLADAPATTIAETTFTAGGRQVPLPFNITYQTSQITDNHAYVVRGSIRSDGALMFTTDQAYPVLTSGTPSRVDLLLVRSVSAAQPWPSSVRAGRLVLAAEALHFIPCGESAPGTLVEDGTGGDAATIIRSLAGEGDEIVVLAVLDSNRLTAVRYAAMEGPACESLLGEADLIARGNEPFWRATIAGNLLTVRTPEDSVVYAGSGWTSPAPGQWRYEAGVRTGSGVRSAVLEISEEHCIDSMSGAHHPFIATLVRDGRIDTGCAVEGRSDQ
ncbi:MAG TPA: YbaY family lipoprotein [Gemmatimonadales bacterium]|nr:YbaY family lipoprotein [Gemmatimonadales bacterium]